MTKKSLKPEPVIVQEHPEDAPAGWVSVQDELASDSGLSMLLVEGHQPPAVLVSNNNSICRAFQTSPEHASLCDPYCGEAHQRAMSAGSVTQYKCHAGLECFTLPVQIGKKRKLAVIGGRAFVTSADYRSIVERLRAGDLSALLEKNPFQNVIFSDQPKLERLSERLQKAVVDYNRDPSAPLGKPREKSASEHIAAIPSQMTSVPAKASTPPAKSVMEMQQEIDRLRDELEYRSRFAESLRHFLERISSTDPQNTYTAILTNSKELLLAERASLFALDETTNELVAKAAIGLSIEMSEIGRIRSGEGVIGEVLETGKPFVVEDVKKAGVKPAPAARKYKTNSFISYPVAIAGRTIGVLNVTDKLNRGKYDDVDLSLLEIIGPQMALALERAEWQERAEAFQLMSITDPLTGLLNRRYLQERLSEELNRSRRYEYAMSFLMIDVDDFKNYNDTNGHQAGDLALQITAHCLKAALRSADVACRYGGEEFAILLPQTPINEAAAIAERMRQRVANTVYPHGKTQPLGRVTISIGVSTFRTHVDTVERVIAAADRALYSAKNKGKDRIEFYEDG
jgi:diguanylate cyclase (GGDEF)-like protein